ncbi:MAG: hypothetical protein JO151_18545 [Verrucomicrobia bacterium]|nr:hypothetical protein [Verrucomicrobiota bacterium]
MARSPSRDKVKEKFWRKAISRQLASGLSQNAFCANEGLNPTNFSWWKREIARRDAAEEPAEGHAEGQDLFVPVVPVQGLSPDPNGAKPIAEIDLSDGRVRIFAGIDRHSLHEIIAALKEVSY